MKGLAEKLMRKILSFWFFAISLVFCVGAFAIGLYRFKMSGELSIVPSDWATFGSYVGGVLGPLVSFVTLIAVIKTVYLQRDLLESQRSELKRMVKLQNDTFVAQKSQSESLAAEALRSMVAKYQDTILRLIDQQLSIQQRVVDLMDLEEQKTASNRDLSWEARTKAEKNITERRVKALKIVDGLSKLSMEVAIAEYGSVSELRELVENKLSETLPWLSKSQFSG
ncbi:hypothetical protein A0O30_23530 [Pseudomonas sp. LLC-1]|uniref:hypothetical protein n=1 Tax=Pseudomonas sp. LLC-1 TaxID=1812180 RepID=UPI000D0208BE|nr:hypothetical protein [Pseudomonas sp. LLC-1]PRN02183.1 hypothetical protein A0O30_23530 [Pseudomonas sp. LLC-1]